MITGIANMIQANPGKRCAIYATLKLVSAWSDDITPELVGRAAFCASGLLGQDYPWGEPLIGESAHP